MSIVRKLVQTQEGTAIKYAKKADWQDSGIEWQDFYIRLVIMGYRGGKNALFFHSREKLLREHSLIQCRL
jgi:hypothetical protein